MKKLRHRVIWLGAFFIAACGFAAQIPLHALRTYDTPMRRRTVIITLLLILGAIVNIAVAWASAYYIDIMEWEIMSWTPPYGEKHNIDRDGDVEWFTDVYRGPGGAFVYSGRWTSDEPYFGAYEPNSLASKKTPRIGDLHRDQSLGRRAVEGRGWPMLALWCEYDADGISAFDDLPIAGVHGGFQLGIDESRHYYYVKVPVVFPYRPLFPGFMINTLIYALLLWLLVATPFAARRMIRRRRGLCEKCAYPVGVSSVCTECGAAVFRTKENNH